MSTGGKLEVQIGADITDFEKKIKEVESDIRELSKIKLDQLKLGLDTREINAQIKDAKNSLATLKDSVGKTGGAIGGQFTKQTANGSNALMQFSRIAQDAPYGIIGIGNNITATVESFGHLKNSTGSASGALKAMASSLMGTGGILLGVSLLTTGFTLLAQSGLSVSDIIDKVTGDFDEFGDAIKKASEEGAKSTAKEISVMNALVSVAQNDALAKKDRLIAVDKLQSQFPGYFGQLSDEKIMYGDLTSVIKQTTKALLNKAIADKLAENNAGTFVEKLKANARYLKEKARLDAFDKRTTELLANAQGSSAAQIATIEAKRLSGRNDILESLDKEKQEIDKLTKSYERVESVVQSLYGNTIKLEQPAAPKASKPKNVRDQFPSMATSTTASGLFAGGVIEMPVINGDKALQSLKDFNTRAGTEFTLFMKLADEFNENFSSFVNDSIASTFGNLGTVIGDALASGQNVFSAIGSSLLQSLSSFLSDMGDLLIKYGILAVAKGKLDLAILTGGPVSIGAGLAAIAVGVLLKAASGALGAKAKGGQTSTSTGSTANNTSTTSGSTGGWSGGSNGTVVFEIAGTSLIGVLNNTTARNLRIGGR